MIAIRAWRDVTIIDDSNDPMSTAVNYLHIVLSYLSSEIQCAWMIITCNLMSNMLILLQ